MLLFKNLEFPQSNVLSHIFLEVGDPLSLCLTFSILIDRVKEKGKKTNTLWVLTMQLALVLRMEEIIQSGEV